MFNAHDAQLAFAVLRSASCTTDASSGVLQPLLVRASTSTAACPLLIALRDLLLRSSGTTSGHTGGGGDGAASAQQLVSQQLVQYEAELRDAERQCEPLRIARDKLRAEQQRVEALLQAAEAAVRRSNDGALVCRSLLQSVSSNSERGFDPAAALSSMAGGASSGGPNAASSAAVSNNSSISSNRGSAQQNSGSAQQQQQQQPQHQPAAVAPSQSSSAATKQQESIVPMIPARHPSAAAPPAQQSVPLSPPRVATAHADATAHTTTAFAGSNGNAAFQQPVVPPTIQGTTELLRICQRKGRDDEHRAQLIPFLARVETRLGKPGAMVDTDHAQLAAAANQQLIHLPSIQRA